MPADWKGQKKRDAEPSEMVSVRTPTRLKDEAQKIANAGDSTLAAAVRWGLEKFVEEFGKKPAAKSGLFE